MNRLAPTTAATFEQDVIESPIPVVVDFSASGCAPCRALLPLLERFAEEYAGRIKFVTVAIDSQIDLAARFEVFAIPTLLMFAKGEVVDILTATLSAMRLRSSLETLL